MPLPQSFSAHPPLADATLGPVRAIAAFEAAKGLSALLACAGLLSLLHHDLHRLAEALIGHIGLDPGARYPAALLRYVDLLQDANLRALVGVATSYALVRFAEAYGLWNARPWGEWLAVLSGALYVPFEVRHLLHKPTALGAIVLASNLAVVGFMAWRLGRRGRRAAA